MPAGPRRRRRRPSGRAGSRGGGPAQRAPPTLRRRRVLLRPVGAVRSRHPRASSTSFRRNSSVESDHSHGVSSRATRLVRTISEGFRACPLSVPSTSRECRMRLVRLVAAASSLGAVGRLRGGAAAPAHRRRPRRPTIRHAPGHRRLGRAPRPPASTSPATTSTPTRPPAPSPRGPSRGDGADGPPARRRSPSTPSPTCPTPAASASSGSSTRSPRGGPPRRGTPPSRRRPGSPPRCSSGARAAGSPTSTTTPPGFVLYAPPAFVPRSMAFPTSPVSADAVLLMTARVLPRAHRRRPGPDARPGRRQGPHPPRRPRRSRPSGSPPEPHADRAGRAGLARCLVPADLLLAVGFKTVRPAPPLPAAAARAQDRAVLARGRRAGARAHPRHGPRPGPRPAELRRTALTPRRRREPARSRRSGQAGVGEDVRQAQGAGRRVLLAQVEPLDGDHERLGDGVPEARRRPAGAASSGLRTGSRARPGRPASA